MQVQKKSLFVAYLYWLFGGLFGLHHLYLGRDLHAFITFATLGGYFGLGWLRDAWRLPDYVKEANCDYEYTTLLKEQTDAHAKPPSSWVRHMGLMIVGNLFAYLIEHLSIALIPLASAVGVWLVGNVGRHKGSIVKPLIFAYMAAIPAYILQMHPGSVSTIVATLVFNSCSKEWRLESPKQRRRKSLAERLAILSLFTTIYLSLWASWFSIGCAIEDPETREPIPCREALSNFLKSPAFANLSEVVFMLWNHVRHQGVSGLWAEIMQEFDVAGRTKALQVLGLDDSATDKDIASAYRKLAREYHPDREHDDALKADKQERFIELQKAYKILKRTGN